MRVRGREVLYALRDLERAEEVITYTTAGEIGRAVGRKDGRAVTRTLQRLEDAGLASRVGYVDPFWRSTPRGQEVERLCSAADAHRGGEFVPLSEVLPNHGERLAIVL